MGSSHHHHHRPPLLKKLRRLMFISPVVSVLSVLLLLWSYSRDNRVIFTHTTTYSWKFFSRPNRTFQLWTQQHRATTEPPSHSPGQTRRFVMKVQEIQESGSKCATLRQTAARGQTASLVSVHGTKTLVVSAYLEHRTNQKEVHIIAVVLRSETVAYRCLFCCREELHMSEGISDVHSDHFGFAYGTADITCPLPSGCESTSHVAVMSAAADYEVTADTQFVEVKNQKVPSGSFPYSFTVCLSTMFDFTNVLQLVQGLEMLQLLGVNRVVVYKTSCNPETQRVLDYYTHTGLVEVIPWSVSRFVNVSQGWLPLHGPGDLHYFGQIPALNDCVYRHMYTSRYVALQDIDELILPQSVHSWLELLPLLEEIYGVDQCYQFENNVFPNTVTLPPPASQAPPPPLGQWQNVSGVNILAHLYQEPITDETRYSNFKIIVNPRAVISPTVHGLLSSLSGCSWVDRSIARMYHTRGPKQPNLTPDQLIYDGRLLSYSERLTLSVDLVLRRTGLIPEDSTV